MTFEVLQGDCVSLMAAMPAGSVDAVVCDPPYGLEFMGKDWDRLQRDPHWEAMEIGKDGRTDGRNVPMFQLESPRYDPQKQGGRRMQEWHQAWATEALRVLKPGGHLLAFGGTRTYHRLVCAVEDAGFEVRDTISWLYGSGFPKSLDVGKAIDRANGKLGVQSQGANYAGGEYEPREKAFRSDYGYKYAPATPEAERWEGWGTALKPAHEPVVVARKPLSGTVAGNVLEHGTGALNVDGCRVEAPSGLTNGGSPRGLNSALHMNRDAGIVEDRDRSEEHPAGRWPANCVLSHTEGCVQVGTRKVKGSAPASGPTLSATESVAHGDYNGERGAVPSYQDETVGAWSCTPDCPVRLLDEQTGERPSGAGNKNTTNRDNGQTIGHGLGAGVGDGIGGDRGGASRFFFVAQTSDADGMIPPCDADTATESSSQLNPPGGSVPSGAATEAPHADSTSTDPTPSPEPSTSGTPSESSNASESDTPPTPSTGGKSSPEQLPTRPTPSNSPASNAEASGQTDTTTTTPSPSTSDGSVDGATSPDTLRSTDRGAKDLQGERFRYVAKASRAERNAGLEGFDEQGHSVIRSTIPICVCGNRTVDSGWPRCPRCSTDMREGTTEERVGQTSRNVHPTVKPIQLMRWLVRLVTPPGGTVLDPFAGSGTTGCAAVLEGFDFIGLEREPEYVKIAEARIAWWYKHRGDGEAADILAAGELRDSVEATGQLGIFDEETE